MTITVIVLASLVAVAAIGMLIVFGGVFRSGDVGAREGRWPAGGAWTARRGNLSPPLFWIGTILTFWALILLLAIAFA